jgi:endonuclease/exonuclease/phosphatase family metal-dependent hydrolase
MKRFFLFLFRLAFWISLPGYLLCAASSYLPSSFCFFSDALALAFPFALAVLLLLLLISLFIQRNRSLLAFIILLAGFRNIKNTIAFHPFASQQQATDSSSIKVLTWNVFYFLNDHEIKNDTPGSSRRQMISLISNANADVLCFQEYLSINGSRFMVSMNHILDSMGYKYRVYSKDMENHHWAGGISQHGTILFSRLPFTDSGRIQIHGEHAVYADVFLQHKKLRIYTAHLVSLGLYTDTANTAAAQENVYKLTYQRKGSILRKIKNTALQHETEAKILDSTFNSSTIPLIFCADMNAVPASYTYSRVRGRLQDAFLEKGFGLGQTYYGISPTLRIDVCFADQRLQVTGCYVNPTHLSDHFPVISTFRWKE